MINKMLPIRKIAYNTIFQVMGKAANILIGVLAIAFLARYLNPDGFGKYTTVLSFLQIVGIIFDFGLYLVLLSEISKIGADRNYIFSNILTLRIVSGVLFFVAIPILVLFFPYSTDIKIGILVTSLTFFLNSIIQIYSAIFQKEMKMDKVVYAEVIAKVFFLSLIVLFIFMKLNLIAILCINNINSAIFLFILYLYSRKYISYSWTIDLIYWKKVLHISWPIAVTTILNLIYFKADTIILSVFKTPTDVGYYGAAYKILEVITTLPHMILGLILPIFSVYWVGRKLKDFNFAMQKFFNIFCFITFALIAIFSAEASGIINFIAGEEYQNSVGILQILIWPTAIIFFGSLFNYGIIAIEKQKEIIKYFFVVAIISLISYFVFIPKYSYYGAAYTTLAVELIMTILSYALLYKYIKWRINFSFAFKIGIISFITYIILQRIQYGLFIELIIGPVIYMILIFALNFFDKSMFKQLISPSHDS